MPFIRSYHGYLEFDASRAHFVRLEGSSELSSKRLTLRKASAKMLKALRIGLLSAALLFAHLETIQSAFCGSQSKADEDLIRRIEAGDGAAMMEAGKTGNRRFIPYVREAIKLDTKNLDTADPARLALARLGETYELQEEWCRAISGEPTIVFDAPIEELGLVGGWFAIQALQTFLTPEGAELPFRNAPKRKHVSDVAVLSPSYYALKTLPDTVSNPPVRFNDQQMDQQAKIWQDWIAAHKDELSKLQPTGEGVDFSDAACKNGKPRTKH
jgi:hypothetical protein